MKIVGDCKYCQKKYCSLHRLAESHVCPNLEWCRTESFEKNTSKLMKEKCVADKI